MNTWGVFRITLRYVLVACTGGKMVVYNTGWLGIGEHMGRVSYHSALCACGVLSVSLRDVYLWRVSCHSVMCTCGVLLVSLRGEHMGRVSYLSLIHI